MFFGAGLATAARHHDLNDARFDHSDVIHASLDRAVIDVGPRHECCATARSHEPQLSDHAAEADSELSRRRPVTNRAARRNPDTAALSRNDTGNHTVDDETHRLRSGRRSQHRDRRAYGQRCR
jgi:hypothetical protein